MGKADAPVRRGRALAVVARAVCWPIVAALYAVGLAVHSAGAGLARLRGEEAPGRSLRRFAAQGRDYLVGRSDRFPPVYGKVPLATESAGPWHEVKRRLRTRRMAMASLVGIVLYGYVALAAALGWGAAEAVQGDRALVYARPSIVLWPLSEARLGEHPFGTDQSGRDVLAMTVQGTKTALLVGTLAGLLASVVGLVLGAIAGYFGRLVDEVVVWGYTTVDSIPYLLLMLSFGFLFKKNDDFRKWWEESWFGDGLGVSVGLFTIVLAVGLTYWVGVCRLVRGEFIRQRERDYVTAARALGVPTGRVIFRHIAPNVLHLVLISFSLLFMAAVKSEVILSFLGVGLDEGEDASWGKMISGAKLELIRADPVWWQLTAATVAMFGLLLCVNLFTDALRDALDPKLKL